MPFRILGDASFEPDTVIAMTTAFDRVMALRGQDRSSPDAEIVANKIIEIARLGERDPERIYEIAVKSLQH